MPQQKGFKQMLLRFPVRVLCLVLLALVALVAINAVQYSPIEDSTKPGNFYVVTGTDPLSGLPVTDVNGNAYQSDLYNADTTLNFLNVGIIAGSIVGVFFLAWLLGFLPKKLPVWIFPVIGAVVAFLFVYGLQLKPSGESATMVEWMVKYATGDYSFTNDALYKELMTERPYDAGYLLFLLPIIYLDAMLGYVLNISANMVYLQYINVVLLALSVWLILRATAKLFGKTAAQVAGLLSVAFLPLAMFAVALTAEIPALFFASIAIERSVVYLKNEKRLADGGYVFNKRNGKVFTAIIIALAMALAIVLRANYMVLGVALAIVFLLDLVRNWRWKNLIVLVVLIALVAMNFLGYYPAALAANALVPVGSNYTPYATLTGTTIAGGLQTNMTNSAQNQINAVSASNVTLFFNSLLPQWLNPTFGLVSGIENHLTTEGGLYPLPNGELGILPTYLFYSPQKDANGLSIPNTSVLDAYLVTTVSNAVMNIIYIFALLGLLVCIFRASVERLILPLYVFGGMAFHLLFGINTTSGLPYMIALLALAGYGLAWLAGRLHSKKRRDDPYNGISRKKHNKFGDIEAFGGGKKSKVKVLTAPDAPVAEA